MPVWDVAFTLGGVPGHVRWAGNEGGGVVVAVEHPDEGLVEEIRERLASGINRYGDLVILYSHLVPEVPGAHALGVVAVLDDVAEARGPGFDFTVPAGWPFPPPPPPGVVT